MGRTSKYKKIKAFDPFSKRNGGKISLGNVGIWGLSDNGAKPKKRSRTAERMRQEKVTRRIKRQEKRKNFNPNAAAAASYSSLGKNGSGGAGLNRPPSDDEDEFDMADLQGSLARHKPESGGLEEKGELSLPTVKSSSKGPPSSDNTTNSTDPTKTQDVIDRKELREATELLKMDPAGKEAVKKAEGRRGNESKRAYNKRVKTETRQIIKQQKSSDLNPEKKRRKKEFLKQKKQKKRGKGQTANNSNDYDSDEDYNGRQPPEEEVHFTVQALRPPTFKTLPRGATAKKGAAGNKKMKTDKDVQAEQENLERMRQKVQEQYAIIKAKRKRAGDFHL